jgi:hypothetical protein
MTIDDAYNHRGICADLKRQLEQTEKKDNPYQEQIEELTELPYRKWITPE